ncbi:NTF2-like protein [Perilla frutescens var. hirtella]|uniref:NTF2-like protein n=1 Tax=Perilla frutescens var. hirtella TaxID=608512 RepID=A0AAD4JD20_PERFH|nr:NTF2-like protein [Perilla frutescens var. frutescens]KAH6775994.1 NTF2-like protein [Perilla frutescens var. hirtella]KAH6831584.1 NTF2-like protein [Perilla frutescens var. hirtella]
MEEEAKMVGAAFVDHYYHLFDHDRAAVVSLYHPTSMLTFEGQKMQGGDQISAKLNQLPFDQCLHVISTVDSQPSAFAGGVIVFVSGSLRLHEEEHPLRFSQMFHLVPTGEGSYFVQNDIFRLNYG